MLGSISSCVQEVIDVSPFISEMLIDEVISFSNLARFIKPKVEALYGESVSIASIIMAIRRYAEDLKRNTSIARGDKRFDYHISLKSNIFDINFMRSEKFLKKLPRLFEQISQEQGDFLNVTLGDRETSLSVSDKYKETVYDMIDRSEILNEVEDCAAVTIVFRDNAFIETPGLLYLAVRKLAWEGINVIEVLSTTKVLTFVVERENGTKAYDSLQKFLSEEL